MAMLLVDMDLAHRPSSASSRSSRRGSCPKRKNSGWGESHLIVGCVLRFGDGDRRGVFGGDAGWLTIETLQFQVDLLEIRWQRRSFFRIGDQAIDDVDASVSSSFHQFRTGVQNPVSESL